VVEAVVERGEGGEEEEEVAEAAAADGVTDARRGAEEEAGTVAALPCSLLGKDACLRLSA
jgi:hypothetical protein